MPEIRICQCLCGPRRHAIVATVYERTDEVNEKTAPARLKAAVEALLRDKIIDPRCGICMSPPRCWVYEDELTLFRTIEEATRRARRLEDANALARLAIGAARN